MYGHQNQTLMVGDMAILPCQASGRIDPSITWFKDNEQLKLSSAENDYPTSRFRQLSTGTLQISYLKYVLFIKTMLVIKFLLCIL